MSDTEGTTPAPESATPEPVTCRRYPCDSAHRRTAHQPNEDGEVRHRVGVGRGVLISSPQDPIRYAWYADVTSVSDETGDGLWRVRLQVGDRYVDLDREEAEELAQQAARAALWAAKYNQTDAEHETDRLQRRVWDMEERDRVAVERAERA